MGLLGLKGGGHLRWSWRLCFLVCVVQTACTQYFKRSVSVTLTNRTAVENFPVFSISQTGRWPRQQRAGMERHPGLPSASKARPISQGASPSTKGFAATVHVAMKPVLSDAGAMGAPSRRLPGAEGDHGNSGGPPGLQMTRVSKEGLEEQSIHP